MLLSAGNPHMGTQTAGHLLGWDYTPEDTVPSSLCFSNLPHVQIDKEVIKHELCSYENVINHRVA